MRKSFLSLFVVWLLFPYLTLEASPTRFHDFPQIGDGGGIQSVFLITNQTNDEATISIRFLTGEGTAMELPTDLATASTIEFKVPAGGMRRVKTQGTSDPVKVGWARLVASAPVGAQVLFEIRFENKLVTQAAVESAAPSFSSCIFVGEEANSKTGLAVAGLSELGETKLELILRDGEGMVVATTEILLGSLQQKARFVSELFDGVNGTRGTLCVNSSNRILLVALQQSGLVLGTLPPIQE